MRRSSWTVNLVSSWTRPGPSGISGSITYREVTRLVIQIACVALAGGGLSLPALADTHIYAGALGTNQNDKLNFSNGALFDARLSSFSLPQVLRTNGLNA